MSTPTTYVLLHVTDYKEFEIAGVFSTLEGAQAAVAELEESSTAALIDWIPAGPHALHSDDGSAYCEGWTICTCILDNVLFRRFRHDTPYALLENTAGGMP
jgi:hypothetical protein